MRVQDEEEEEQVYPSENGHMFTKPERLEAMQDHIIEEELKMGLGPVVWEKEEARDEADELVLYARIKAMLDTFPSEPRQSLPIYWDWRDPNDKRAFHRPDMVDLRIWETNKQGKHVNEFFL